jgi:hypothetical protein
MARKKSTPKVLLADTRDARGNLVKGPPPKKKKKGKKKS